MARKRLHQAGRANLRKRGQGFRRGSGPLTLLSGDSFRVEMLESLHPYLSPLQGCDTFGGGAGGRERGDGGDAGSHRGATDRLLVEPWLGTVRRVDDQVDSLAL